MEQQKINRLQLDGNNEQQPDSNDNNNSQGTGIPEQPPVLPAEPQGLRADVRPYLGPMTRSRLRLSNSNSPNEQPASPENSNLMPAQKRKALSPWVMVKRRRLQETMCATAISNGSIEAIMKQGTVPPIQPAGGPIYLEDQPGTDISASHNITAIALGTDSVIGPPAEPADAHMALEDQPDTDISARHNITAMASRIENSTDMPQIKPNLSDNISQSELSNDEVASLHENDQECRSESPEDTNAETLSLVENEIQPSLDPRNEEEQKDDSLPDNRPVGCGCYLM